MKLVRAMTRTSGQRQADLGGRLGPSITGMLDVHEDHVGVDEPALVEGLQAVRRLADHLDVRVGGEQHLEALAHHLVVVDDQHPDVVHVGHAPILSRGRSSKAGCSHAARMVVPRARRALHRERARDALQTLAHDAQSHVAAAGDGGGIEPSAVVRAP